VADHSWVSFTDEKARNRQGTFRKFRGGRNANIAVCIVNPPAPTFPPTSIDHATYPWIDPFNPQEPINNCGANALCYLIMTDFAIPPKPPQLEYSGAWVASDPFHPGRDAILCINSSQFWESWLLPQLQSINNAIQFQALEPVMEKDNSVGLGGCAIRLDFSLRCTEHTYDNDSYYKFEKSKDGLSWTWEADENLLSTHNELKNMLTLWKLDQKCKSEANTPT
jgi:hypothetical protein